MDETFLHIVRPLDGWILQRVGDNFCRSPWTVGDKPNPKAKWNFYVNYAFMNRFKKTSREVALFTHKPDDAVPFKRAAKRVSACVAMCDITASFLDRSITEVIHLGIEDLFCKPLVLGVVGRAYKDGRKRLNWIEEINKMDRVKVKHADVANIEDLPEFYRSIDYLLVTSRNEGGPMPVRESLASGTPVIAPNVGFCWEYSVIRYDGTFLGLKSVIEGLRILPGSWERSRDQLKNFLERF